MGKLVRVLPSERGLVDNLWSAGIVAVVTAVVGGLTWLSTADIDPASRVFLILVAVLGGCIVGILIAIWVAVAFRRPRDERFGGGDTEKLATVASQSPPVVSATPTLAFSTQPSPQRSPLGSKRNEDKGRPPKVSLEHEYAPSNGQVNLHLHVVNDTGTFQLCSATLRDIEYLSGGAQVPASLPSKGVQRPWRAGGHNGEIPDGEEDDIDLVWTPGRDADGADAEFFFMRLGNNDKKWRLQRGRWRLVIGLGSKSNLFPALLVPIQVHYQYGSDLSASILVDEMPQENRLRVGACRSQIPTHD